MCEKEIKIPYGDFIDFDKERKIQTLKEYQKHCLKTHCWTCVAQNYKPEDAYCDICDPHVLDAYIANGFSFRRKNCPECGQEIKGE